MPPYVLAAIAAVALGVPVLTWSLLAGDPVRARSTANLQRGLAPVAATASPTGRTAGQSALARLARRLLPSTVVRLERLLVRAGRPAGWSLDRVLAAKLVLPVLVAALGVVYVQAVHRGIALVVVVAVTVLAAFVPDLLLRSRADERGSQITRELADVLDQVAIAVEAGLGFDAAMARAARGPGPLAVELRRTQQDMQVGQSRRQAYESLAARTGVADLARFVRAVLQADAYGIAVADVLRTQASEARLRRRQQAEEKAMKIPTKVVLPLVLFILPVMFIILLGPAVMGIITIFG